MPSPFDPAPALPSWNNDWESGGPWPTGDDGWFRAMFDYRVYNLFVDAINERIQAHDSSTAGYIAHLTDGDYSLQAWFNLQESAQGLLLDAILAYADDWTPITYSTAFNIVDMQFPQPYPLRRKYPREITSLSATGTDGWFARLIGGASHSGNIYERVSGVWLPAAVGSKPDILSDVWGPSTTGSGDYWGPWILNDLRDLINRVVVFGQFVQAGTYFGSQLTLENHGENCTNTGIDAAEYASGVNLNTGVGLNAQDEGGPGPFQRQCGYVQLTGYNPAVARDLYIFTFGNIGGGVFDNFGDPVSLNLLQLAHKSPSPVATSDYVGPKLGNLDLPVGTIGEVDEYASYYGGFDITNFIVLFERWDVVGGFTYVH